ncbi:hypothetical protein T492DRAFT_882942 [Pavlovales sp. CCMP2436]|nr:hypothetical protein T492DRAFT_882942 [Pavlovales sp. CCMP2436]
MTRCIVYFDFSKKPLLANSHLAIELKDALVQVHILLRCSKVYRELALRYQTYGIMPNILKKFYPRRAEVGSKIQRNNDPLVHFVSEVLIQHMLIWSPSTSEARAHVLLATLGESDAPGLRAQVYHKDGDQMNNTPANLRWTTPSKNTQRSHTNNSNLKSSAIATSKPVRGRKQGTADEWRQFESCSAAARKLGPGFYATNIGKVASGSRTNLRGWTFEYTQQYAEIEGEQWRSIVLGGVESGALHTYVCHKDGDPSNNTPGNLRWTTPGESIQRSFDNNPNFRKSNAAAMSKPVRGRKQGTEDEWRQFESCAAAARELGPGFFASGISAAANGRCTHAHGWTFKYTQQYEEIAGEVWKDVVLPSASSSIHQAEDGDAPPGLWAQVSDRGRFRSTQGVIHGGSLYPTGFCQVMVDWKSHRLHHLVCTTLHGPPPTPEHTEVFHKEGDHSNNTPGNLRWSTPGESNQRSRDKNPNRKSNATAMSKPYTQQYEEIEGEQWRSVVLGGVESGAHHTYVCHKDGDHLNNTPGNLRWTTPGERNQRLLDNNPNRKLNAAARAKPLSDLTSGAGGSGIGAAPGAGSRAAPAHCVLAFGRAGVLSGLLRTECCKRNSEEC